MFLSVAFRLMGFTLGAGVYLFLIVLLARKRGAGWVDRLILIVLIAGFSWHVAGAAGLSIRASTGAPLPLLFRALDFEAAAGLIGSPIVAAVCLFVRRRAKDTTRRFLLWVSVALLAVTAAGAAAGVRSATLVFVSLGPPVCLAYFIYRYHLLDLQISRRIVFAVTLGAVFAVYLLLVKRTAQFLEDEFGAFGAFIELALILAATLVWLPLYGWMTGFLSRRTQVYADFSKSLIEDAARILDLGQRVQFLAEQVGRSFELHRCLLVTGTGPRLFGVFGSAPAVDAGTLESEVRRDRIEFAHVTQTGNPVLKRILKETGFQYLFPLWYENHLTGLLLLDVSPRMFLDEGEQILLGLSRQISHSIETCRVIDEKIGLERTLVQQEHLASLGKVAATIAHEIKNPLSSIKTLVQLMGEDEKVKGPYGRDLSYITAEIDRLNRSMKQLLRFSRPGPETADAVDLSDLIGAMAGVLAREYAAEQIRIESSTQPGLTLRHASPETLKQIVLNLALNAVQASAANSTVRLEAERLADGGIALAVSDQGSGIPAELRDRIFEPFFTTKQQGTGLGLAIVKKHVRLLGGEIQVESPWENGRGTRIRITFPRP